MFAIQPYRDEFAREWDTFVEERAVNAGFMQTRNFIAYHPAGRFLDGSLCVRETDGSLAAVVPACDVVSDGQRVFYSHRGCTYGGVAIDRRRYKAAHVVDIVHGIDAWIGARGYDRAVVKLPGGIYTGVESDLVEYALFAAGFSFDLELNTYVDLTDARLPAISRFTNGKRGHVRKCERAGLVFRRVERDDEVRALHRLLALNLRKHGVEPVHTADELLEFKNSRLTGITRFYGVFLGETLLAGGMVYDYERASTIHTTYLAADPGIRHLSPSTFLYHGIIEEARRLGRRRVAFGISTERSGHHLNRGLIQNKESYGALHCASRAAWKEYRGGGEADAES